MILVIGAAGNMGQRYCKILKYLNEPFCAYDTSSYGVNLGETVAKHKPTGFIVATPTETHCSVISYLMAYRKPILCEKPITKDKHELANLLKLAKKMKTNLQMVNQYAFMNPGTGKEPTRFSYFKHGGDGIAWDCINIIGMAKGSLAYNPNSPIWDCMINGIQQNHAQIDHSYIRMVRAWLKKPTSNIAYIERAHNKVMGIKR